MDRLAGIRWNWKSMKPRHSFLLVTAFLLSLCSSQAQGPVVINSSQVLNDRSFLLLYNGNPGTSYRIMASADLVNWDTLAYQIADVSFGDFAFLDRTAPFLRARFYAAGLTGGDGTFPSLNITAPTPNQIVNQSTTLLQGTASDGSGIREIRLNDSIIPGTTSFSTLLTLVPGTNRFLVSATDSSSNRNRRSQIVQVQYAPTFPTILTQPVNQTNDVGTTALFGVVATGTEPLSYQWRKDDVDLADSEHFSGTTSATLAITSVGARDVAGYAVLISNANGSVTSSVATLTLKTPAGLIPVIGPGYAENFNSMGSAGTTTPTGWFVGTGTGAIGGTSVIVTAGTATAGGNYNFGSAGNSDRAFGSLAGNNLQRDTEARFINATGSNITSFIVSYTGEQWRQGGASAVNNDLVMQFSSNGTNFTAMGVEFTFNTPFDTGTAGGALDGNNATNRVTDIGGVYFPASVVTNAGVFYLRWADADSAGTDHSIAIDDLSVTFTFEEVP